MQTMIGSLFLPEHVYILYQYSSQSLGNVNFWRDGCIRKISGGYQKQIFLETFNRIKGMTI